MANSVEWIYDTGASRHLCANKELMQGFEDVVNEKCVYIENSTTARVMGKGNILLKFAFEKLLSLRNVLFVPFLRKNLELIGVKNMRLTH